MPTVHARTVRRAAEILGGVEVLAAQLDVRDENLKKWLEGTLAVPQEIFLRCVDIVNAHQSERNQRVPLEIGSEGSGTVALIEAL